MARIRTIKPEFWGDEKLAPLPDHVRLVFLALWSMADDLGRLLDNERQIDAFVFSGTPDGRTRDTREALDELSRLSRIQRGVTASGQAIIQVTNWKRHQRIDRPSLKSCLPEIVTLQPVSNARETLASDSRETRAPTLDLGPTTVDLRPTTGDREPTGLPVTGEISVPENPALKPPSAKDIARRNEAIARLAEERAARRALQAVPASGGPSRPELVK